jgi:arginyl-tRNA synthetase
VAGERYGRASAGEGKRVQVEFVSANPTGPLTVGHGRGAVYGDTVARLYEWTGHTVEREYYFNNAGRQMRVLGDSVRLRYLELLGDPVEFPEDYYQGEYIREIARQLHEEHGAALRNELQEPGRTGDLHRY